MQSERIDRRNGMSGYCTWLVSLALLLPLAAIAEKPRPMYQLEVSGTIRIGPDGHVRDYELKSALDPAIAGIVDKQVRSWAFEPIQVDGKPVIAETSVKLSLEAMPAENGNYALRIAHVWFGQPLRKHQLAPPRYPTSAAYAGLGARVVLVLRLDPQGNVIEIFPEQTSLTRAGSEDWAKAWRELFEEKSIAAARKWKFAITEMINGKPIGSSVRVPVAFEMEGSRRSAAQWQAYAPGPVRPVPWVDSDDLVATAPSRDALEDGDMQALESRFKLKQDVVGKVL